MWQKVHQLPCSRNAEGAPRDTKGAYDLQVYTFRAGDGNRTRALSLGRYVRGGSEVRSDLRERGPQVRVGCAPWRPLLTVVSRPFWHASGTCGKGDRPMHVLSSLHQA
jgi:hypothetical protein